MIKIATKFGPKEIEEAFDRLSTKEKLEMVETFERKTRKERWDALLKNIRSRARKNPISQKEINRICEQARQELYERKTQSHR